MTSKEVEIKKILFAMPDFRGGGAEGVFIQIANYLCNKYVIEFIVLKKNGANLKRLNESIKVKELNVKSSIRAIFKINEYINKNKFNVVIGTLAMAHAISIAKFFNKQSSCRYIARLGNTITSDLDNFSSLKRIVMRFYQKVLAFADVVICQSKYMEKDLKKYCSCKVVQIYNPIHLKSVQSLAEVDIDNTFENKGFCILSIGRLSFQKDYKTGILAFSKFLKENKDAKYYILGDGLLKQELIKYVHELKIFNNVTFLGYVSNPYPYLKKANVLLLTSLYEGFSNVILESLALKTPVIVTNSPGGNAEIIEESKNGFLVPVKDDIEIAKSLQKIKNGQSFDMDVCKFDIKIIGEEYAKLF